MDNISFERAFEILLENIRPLSPVLINTEDSINGILAEDIYSNIDFPFYDSSLMDGYALRIKEEWCDGDLKSETVFKIVDEKAVNLDNFETAKIMTGEPVPENTNVLIKIEDVFSGGFLKDEKLILPKGFEFR